VVRSLNTPAALRLDDTDNRLLDLGLCDACAGSVAYLYVNRPTSQCALVAKQALAGSQTALAALLKNPDYCVGK
jgi:hypothetical protein